MPRPANPVFRFWHWLIGPPPRDHRGRRVKIIRFTQLPRDMAARISKLPPDIHDRVLAEFSKAQHAFPWLQFSLLFVLFVCFTILYEWHIKPFAVQTLAPVFGRYPSQLGLSILTAPLPALMILLCYRRSIKAAIITSTLKFNYCPSCGYSLETAKPELIDHCTLCPECGAAWKLSPPASP